MGQPMTIFDRDAANAIVYEEHEPDEHARSRGIAHRTPRDPSEVVERVAALVSALDAARAEIERLTVERDTALRAMGEAQDGIEKLATALGVTDYVCSIGPLLAEIERLRTAAAAKAGASFDSCDCPACQFMRRKPERTAADERADVVAMFRARSRRWRESDTSIGQTVSRLYGESAIEVEQGAHVGAAKGGAR